MTAMRLHRYPSPSGGFALGKMGVGATMLKQGKTARDYIQDGLVAMWDGIENAGWGVHDPNATIWKDLSGDGYDMNVISPSSWEQYGIRAQGNIVAKTGNVIPVSDQVYGELCMEAQQGNVTGVYFWNDGDSGGYGRQKFLASDTTANPPFFSIGYGIAKFSALPNINGTFQVNWGNRAARYNNESISSISGSYNPQAYSREMVIGGRSAYGGSYGFYCVNALIRAVRLYSRALTADEIARNYAIDKARFNLP